MTLRLSFFLLLVSFSISFCYSLHLHPLLPSFFCSLLSASVAFSRISWVCLLLFSQSLSLPCVYEIRLNRSPTCYRSQAVWLEHSVLHMGHLWSGLCDLHLYHSIPKKVNVSVCAFLPPSLSYHEAGGPHCGQSGAFRSCVRCGVRPVRLWR